MSALVTDTSELAKSIGLYIKTKVEISITTIPCHNSTFVEK